MELIGELATSHGGDLQLAEDMIAACADAGAHTVKFQSYSLAKLNPKDSQADWLKQAHLDRAAHERLMKACERNKVNFLSTPFDREALKMLQKLGLHRFKIASSEADRYWWRFGGEFLVSWPWGEKKPIHCGYMGDMDADQSSIWIANQHLTAIPLYPTPLECIHKAQLLDGWSDHTEGLSACYRALSLGATILEVHVCWPGRSRQMPFDKTFAQVRQVRDFMDDMDTISTGVAQRFRERWSA